jgi:hypothetical protein
MIASSIGSSAIAARQKGKSDKALRESIALGPEERQARAGMLGAGRELGGLGSMLYGAGVPYMNRAGSYWQTMLGAGGKKRAEQAVAPMAEGIAETYGGAERQIGAGNLRGAQKETALAETGRAKAGAISGLLRGVQPMAANQLGSLGQFATTAGIGAKREGAGIFSDVLGRGAGDRRLGFAAELESGRRGTALGENLGSLLFQMLAQGGGKSGSGGGKYQGLPIGTPAGPPSALS